MNEGLPDPGDWLDVTITGSPVVVVAPHGGHKQRRVRRGDGVNDLHTAEIAAELARRLGASSIINHGLDRNRADLNRIRDLVAKAPEFLEHLRSAVEASGEQPSLLLFVHGWNMVVPCCDLGMGLRRRGEDLFGRYPTVSPEFYRAVVPRIEAAFSNRGLSTAVGMRYAGAGADNALQLFATRHLRHECDAVRALADAGCAGRADAVQLELGIPLRWPGTLRERTLDALCEAFDRPTPKSAEPRRTWKLPPATKVRELGGPTEHGFTTQALLDEGRTGLFAGVESTGPVSFAARVCLVRNDGTMSLFVGEGAWDGSPGRYEDHGFVWRQTEDGAWNADYKGTMVQYRSHRAYEDLEAGLAASKVEDAEIELRLDPPTAQGGQFRMLHYRVYCGTSRSEGECIAVCERGSRRGGRGRSRLFYVEGSGMRAAEGVEFEGEDASVRQVSADDGRLRGRLTAEVPVWRVLPDKTVTRFSFGMAELDDGSGKRIPALFDRLQILGRAGKQTP